MKTYCIRPGTLSCIFGKRCTGKTGLILNLLNRILIDRPIQLVLLYSLSPTDTIINLFSSHVKIISLSIENFIPYDFSEDMSKGGEIIIIADDCNKEIFEKVLKIYNSSGHVLTKIASFQSSKNKINELPHLANNIFIFPLTLYDILYLKNTYFPNNRVTFSNLVNKFLKPPLNMSSNQKNKRRYIMCNKKPSLQCLMKICTLENFYAITHTDTDEQNEHIDYMHVFDSIFQFNDSNYILPKYIQQPIYNIIIEI